MGSKKKRATAIYRVRISENALKNIDEITNYIAFVSKEPAAAIKVGDAIFDTLYRIEQRPFAFRACEELATKSKMYRRAICLSWLIIYRISVFEIVILGVIHSSRKPTAIKPLRRIK
jgi:plasmid stabilization system protein ParE